MNNWKLSDEQEEWMGNLLALEKFDVKEANLQEKLDMLLEGEGVGFADIFEVFEALKVKGYIAFTGNAYVIDDLKITQDGKSYFDRVKDEMVQKYQQDERAKSELQILGQILDEFKQINSSKDEKEKKKVVDSIKELKSKITYADILNTAQLIISASALAISLWAR